MFEEFLRERDVRTIVITQKERLDGHLNVVVTKKGETAVGFETATRVTSEMARHGWHLAPFPADELFRGNGGAHCMTCPMEVR